MPGPTQLVQNMSEQTGWHDDLSVDGEYPKLQRPHKPC